MARRVGPRSHSCQLRDFFTDAADRLQTSQTGASLQRSQDLSLTCHDPERGTRYVSDVPCPSEHMENAGKRVLALIRHGAYAQPPGVPSAHLPYALTVEGRVQAAEAALRIAAWAEAEGLEVDDVIDCSRMLRAWETATLIGAALTARTGQRFVCHEFESLAERSVGAAANLSVDAIEALLRDDPRYELPARGWKRDAEYCLPFQGAESLAQAGERVARHLAACGRGRAERCQPGRDSLKLVVGHGGAFRHAASSLGALSPEQVADLSMQYCDPIYFEYQSANSGLGRLVHKAGSWVDRRERTAASVSLD